jgi:hypothetical protein
MDMVNDGMIERERERKRERERESGTQQNTNIPFYFCKQFELQSVDHVVHISNGIHVTSTPPEGNAQTAKVGKMKMENCI